MTKIWPHWRQVLSSCLRLKDVIKKKVISALETTHSSKLLFTFYWPKLNHSPTTTLIVYPVTSEEFSCCCYLVTKCIWLPGDSMDCSSPGSSVLGILQAEIQRVLPFLLQGIFLSQGSNLHLLHCQVGSLLLSHQGSPLENLAITLILQIMINLQGLE